jgi:N-acetylglucosamine kinase-like BadF-type ATPase
MHEPGGTGTTWGDRVTVVLGVDGGGTKTHAVVADGSGAVLGTSVLGPSNWEEVGLARAADVLERSVRMALAEARVLPRELSASVFGLAGVDWETDEFRLGNVLAPLQLGGTRTIVNDAFVALRAGTSRSWGVVLVAGTGTVAAGRDPQGRTFRTLGLGPYFGDYGGGSDISESAVLAVCEAYLGKGPATALSDVLCRHVRVGSVPELLELIAREQDDLPYVAQDVLETAEAGDEVAGRIVRRAAAELGRNGALVAERLGMAGEPFELVLAGGLLQARSRLLVEPLVATVRERARWAQAITLGVPPVVGAVAMGLEVTDIVVDPELQRRLAQGMTESLLTPPMERL